MIVSEPVFASNGKCLLKVDSLEFRADDAEWILNRSTALSGNYLDVTHLSDEGVSATGIVSVVDAEQPTVQGSLILDFDILTNICSPDPVKPDVGRFRVVISDDTGAPTDTLTGDSTMWDDTIDLIELTDLGGSTEVGMTMFVQQPPVASADSCVLVLTDATLTITKPLLVPPVVRVYRFPGEVAERGVLGVDFITDVVISGRGKIAMQRHDAFGWQEKVSVTVDFDAFEPGYPSALRQRARR
jgi:hypothetical protein